MSDATHMPQSLNEHNGPLAESVLEPPHTPYNVTVEAAPAETGGNSLTEPSTKNLGEKSSDPQKEETMARERETSQAAPHAEEEFATEVDIDWEAEVDAFVKAEAAAQTDAAAAEAVTEAALGCSCAASRTEGEVAESLDAACHCFAGAVGGEETGTIEEAAAADGPKTDDVGQTEEQPIEETIEIMTAEAEIDNFAAEQADSECASTPENPATSASREAASEQPAELLADRRKRRRAMISAPVRVRGVNITNGGPDEISTTIDVSRNGILFNATSGGYYKGMEVAVIFPYSQAPTAIHTEQSGRVVRIIEQANGGTAVAIALGIGIGEDLVDAAGRKLTGSAANSAQGAAQSSDDRPLILTMDPDPGVRASLRSFLEMEGYQVIAVGGIGDARQVLDMCVPALVIAEIEGDALAEEGLPGYDLCAHIKETRRLRNVPVVLTTRSAYPSDYSNAHSLGAIVCMAKPYKQERVGHVVRLLAPLQAHKEAPAVKSCKADPKRKACATPHHGAGHAPLLKQKYDENTNTRRKFRFPTFR
ncbi:MAG TPA: response regulator [Candidatus Aquilonibacter sp.]|nr:response regulator [Candidatus Aquilonibacter sp.]